MLAELPEASREVDLRRGIPRQERRGTLQRLVGLGEAAEFQADLTQEMEKLSGIGARLDGLRKQGFGAGEIAASCQLQAVAAERLDFLVGKCHARALAEHQAGAKAQVRKKKLRVDRRPGSGEGRARAG